MATYNIYGYNNGEEELPLGVTVTLNADDSKIVRISSEDPEEKAEAESVIHGYVEEGLSALDAISRYAGSYGTVRKVGAEEDIVVAAGEEEAESEAPATDVQSDPVEIGDGLMAMTEDDGTVVTLLKREAGSGAVYRDEGAWKPLVDPTVLDNLTFVGVTASAEAVYDRYAGEDKLVSIGHYFASADGPYWPHPIREYPEPETAAEAAAATAAGGDEDEPDDEVVVDEEVVADEPIAASVTLASAEDLDAAIAAAVADPDMRWYVERRVAALGLETSLPWLEG